MSVLLLAITDPTCSLLVSLVKVNKELVKTLIDNSLKSNQEMQKLS